MQRRNFLKNFSVAAIFPLLSKATLAQALLPKKEAVLKPVHLERLGSREIRFMGYLDIDKNEQPVNFQTGDAYVLTFDENACKYRIMQTRNLQRDLCVINKNTMMLFNGDAWEFLDDLHTRTVLAFKYKYYSNGELLSETYNVYGYTHDLSQQEIYSSMSRLFRQRFSIETVNDLPDQTSSFFSCNPKNLPMLYYSTELFA